ncbi:MAG: DUF819 domain-containing protein [Holophagales bacterium]|nr:DUF819 domain-containing protein [Holophagales bacterium]
MSTLLAPTDTFGLWAFLAVGAAVAIWLEQRYRWAAAVTGVLLALFWGMLGVNLRIVPPESPVWDAVWSHLVPLAIALLLFDADLRRIWRESGRMFWIFNLSALGTCLGTVLAVLVVGNGIPDVAAAAALMTGTYIGGTVNLVALSAALSPPKELVGGLLVADNVTMALAFALLVALPGLALVRKLFAHPFEDAVDAMGAGADESGTAAGSGKGTRAATFWKPKEISLADLATALAMALGAVAVSVAIADAVRAIPGAPELVRQTLGQKYLVLPLVMAGLATVFPARLAAIRGAHELGTLVMYLFFVVVGVPASAAALLQRGPILFLFTGIIAAVNVVVTLGAARLFRFTIEEAVLASNATLGGPTTAAGMAVAKGWDGLVLPGILVGVWGYAIGNWVGLLVGRLVAHL